MAFGKMNTFIDIAAAARTIDDEGFGTDSDTILASVRAYRENRHGNERWANMAAFSTASALFRFRKIPDLTVDTTVSILCEGEWFNVISAEDVRGRGMYVEVLAEKTERTVS